MPWARLFSFLHPKAAARSIDHHQPCEDIMMDDTETMNDILARMPWTRDQLTRAQFDEWLASRREAGRVIDIETCQIGRWQANHYDPYGTEPDLPDGMKVVGTNRFVRSRTSNGWINEADLPVEKIRVLYERIRRRSYVKAPWTVPVLTKVRGDIEC